MNAGALFKKCFIDVGLDTEACFEERSIVPLTLCRSCWGRLVNAEEHQKDAGAAAPHDTGLTVIDTPSACLF